MHASGTTKMGNATSTNNDDSVVVDERLRVRNVGHLRVCDASVMPQIPNANIMGAVIMIGEKGAHMVLQDHGLVM